MIKYILVPVGAVVTAVAQIGLKKTSTFENWSRPWFLFLFLSIVLYGIAAFNYLYLLRQFPISKIYPIMTVVIILVITVYGFLTGESITLRHLFGIALGMGAVYLMLF
jgi:drug/metabolite transporter (DMT)-like permease